jgi:hypothetical protein
MVSAAFVWVVALLTLLPNMYIFCITELFIYPEEGSQSAPLHNLLQGNCEDAWSCTLSSIYNTNSLDVTIQVW